MEWSTRIFEDRRKSIRYVCEVPVQIEQRLFALARTVQQAMESTSEKHVLDVDRGWEPVFGQDHAQTENYSGRGSGFRFRKRQQGVLPAVGAFGYQTTLRVALGERALGGVPGHPAVRLAVEEQLARPVALVSRARLSRNRLDPCELAVADVRQPDAAGDVVPGLGPPDGARRPVRGLARCRQDVDQEPPPPLRQRAARPWSPPWRPRARPARLRSPARYRPAQLRMRDRSSRLRAPISAALLCSAVARDRLPLLVEQRNAVIEQDRLDLSAVRRQEPLRARFHSGSPRRSPIDMRKSSRSPFSSPTSGVTSIGSSAAWPIARDRPPDDGDVDDPGGDVLDHLPARVSKRVSTTSW